MNRYTDNPYYKINKNFKEDKETEVVFIKEVESYSSTNFIYAIPTTIMLIIIVTLICKGYKKTCGGW